MNEFIFSDFETFAEPGSDMSTIVRIAANPLIQPEGVRSGPYPMKVTPLRTIDNGRVALDPKVLRTLRHSRMFSQQDLADECERRRIRVSIATIKRAETGRAVRFRIVRELARCFEVPVTDLLPG